jgi:hypothetical protein
MSPLLFQKMLLVKVMGGLDENYCTYTVSESAPEKVQLMKCGEAVRLWP